METLIGSMSGDELQQAIQLLKKNYINADSLNEEEMSRATLQGLLMRIGRGVMLLPAADAARKEASTPSYTEILDGHIGYVRIGSLTAENLKALDATLQTFPAKKVDAIVLDLRAGPATGDFEIAAEFAKRFCAKGKALFTLHKANARQERAFVSDRDPAFPGLVLVLADKDTSGEAEAVAAVLRAQAKALIIGQPTAGRAVEYSDLPLTGGKVLRVPVGEVVLPDRQPLNARGIKPDLPVELAAADKRQIFQMSSEKGMALFVFENERPHLNEAALLAGKNPELEVMEAAQRRGRTQEKTVPRDFVLQRAVDVVTSLAVYQRR
ncbi:MAG: hypothetical protein H0U99_03325 [Chthoniobacterales bacterium]|nr:hypothetical protein [Chthoniobacterales bacterium]